MLEMAVVLDRQTHFYADGRLPFKGFIEKKYVFTYE